MAAQQRYCRFPPYLGPTPSTRQGSSRRRQSSSSTLRSEQAGPRGGRTRAASRAPCRAGDPAGRSSRAAIVRCPTPAPWPAAPRRSPPRHRAVAVILDIFSRYVVAWTVQHREDKEVAKALIAQAVEQQQIKPGTLTVHADRGSAMRSKPVAFLLADLGLTRTHNRPYTSSDNPYSEAHFKTLKYRPGFPDRFQNIEQARDFCRTFFEHYNNHHRHSGIALMPPTAVHHCHATQLHAHRELVLDAAYAANPERFVRKAPAPPALPTAAWINKPDNEEAAH